MKASKIFLLLSFLALNLNGFTQNTFHLPRIFTNNMVLQRNMNIPVWGKAKPESSIKISLNGKTASTVSLADSSWMAYLPPMKAGGPYQLTVNNEKKEITFKNVMVGDVWFASGQSNMNWKVKNAKNAEQEIANANYPNIRLFTVPNSLGSSPKFDMAFGHWVECTSDTIGSFSAVAYYFGREIHLQKKVPVGLIHSSWGGTRAEAWTSTAMLKSHPDFTQRIKKMENANVDFETLIPENKKKRKKRTEILENAKKGIEKQVHTLHYDASNWQHMEIPVHFHDTKIEGFQGFVWLRKSIEIPREYRKKELILRMGKIEQEDITYFNGHKAGSYNVTAQVREYKIPAKWIKKGKNTIAVRVKHTRSHGGGLYEGPYELVDPENNKPVLSLSGKWLYNENIEEKLPEVKSFVHYPGALFNAMVAPVIPYGIKGTIWYQGEGNASRAYQYRTLFPMLINDWRIRWQQGNYPFLFVQLANFLPHDSVPTMDPWPELREAQTMTLNLPNTGMATTIDLGEMYNIHPKNKQDVGKRLSLAAQKIAYHEDIVYSGPAYDSMRVENNKIRIFFSHTGSGLTSKGSNELKGFAIAGKDKKFVWANAQIDGNTILVWSEKVPNPVAVRYAWSNNPVCNLYNKEGLPAIPFRTDHWEGITSEKK